MRKKILFTCGILLVSVLSWAQQISNHWTCDFEDEVQNLTWHFPTNDSVPNQWTISEAVNNGGKRSMYVTPKGKDTTAYANYLSLVYAYTDITLPKSTDKYILSFDWKAVGFTRNQLDAMYVFWVPDKDDLGDSIYISDRNTVNIPNQLKPYMLPLNPAMPCPDSLCGKSTWQTWVSAKTSITDSRLVGGKHRRLVFAWRNGNDGPVNPAACIDNISIVDGRSCGKPHSLTIFTQSEDSLVLDWQGDAEKYEVGCYSYGNDTWQVDRVATNQYVFTEVQEGFTDIYVRAICWDTIKGEEYFSAKEQVSEIIYYPGNHCIDYLTLTDDNCYISTVKPNYVTGDYKYVKQMVDYGSESRDSRHTHHYLTTETDVFTGGRLHTVPEGEIASVRLGNWNKGGESERVEFMFHVDAKQNPVLVMKYAVVLESPGHDSGKRSTSKDLQDPRFTFDVLHNGESIGHCASADYTSSWVYTGWNDTTIYYMSEGRLRRADVVWKDWTTVGVNLEDYDGEDLTIRLTTFDCSLSAHFGYAYFTLGCSNGKLKISENNSFEAPEGFYYRWMKASSEQYRNEDGSIPEQYVMSRNQTFVIDSLDNNDYIVDCMYMSDSTCFYSLSTATCSWLVESNNPAMGSVITDFNKPFYKYGTQITVEASPNAGYKFVKWNDGKKHNPYKFSLLGDKYLRAIFMGEGEEPDTTTVQPSSTTATFTWPFIEGGFSYSLTVYQDSAFTTPFCTITFNQYGQLIGIHFGGKAPHRMIAQDAGFTYTVSGLDADTEYFYKMETMDENNRLINTDEGAFKTTDIQEGIDQITNDQSSITNKVFIDGQLFILRGDKTYTITGQKVKQSRYETVRRL